MPVYECVCDDCGKNFAVTMRISEHGAKEIICESCQGKNV
ncbi:MAG: FmdB family zinc ribbon protein, partial [Desulfuromonadales bacterium]